MTIGEPQHFGQRSAHDHFARVLGNCACVEHGVILLHHRLDFSQACVRTENDFCERAWVAVRGLYFPLRALPVRVRPPENPLEIREARLHFCERGTTQVEKYIGIPPRDFRGPLIFDLRDRKSTRLNSSHGYISYAAFCLKKTT